MSFDPDEYFDCAKRGVVICLGALLLIVSWPFWIIGRLSKGCEDD